MVQTIDHQGPSFSRNAEDRDVRQRRRTEAPACTQAPNRYKRVFDTWEDAWKFLMACAGKEVGAARRNLELANSRLDNVKGMRRPAEAEAETTQED